MFKAVGWAVGWAVGLALVLAVAALKVIGWALRLAPVGWCRTGTPARIWMNRRGGRVVFLGDVMANFGALLHAVVYRVPKGASFVRGKDGWIEWTVNGKEPE